MHQTKAATAILREALAVLGDDFAFSDARFHIKSAIQKIDHVDQKRVKRESLLKQEALLAQRKSLEQKQKMGLGSSDTLRILEYIDKMIQDEHEKMKIANEKRRNKADDEDVQQLLD